MIHIMMATYNGEKYICEQIESILAQTYHEWKLFISDDGSNDHTIEIINKYQERYPNKIFILESRNTFHNAKDNFSYLLKKIPEAEYYTFCDQDDIWLIDKLEKMLYTLQKRQIKNIVLAYHDMLVGENLEKTKHLSYYEYTKINLNTANSLQQTLLYNTIPGCSMLFNHELRKRIVDIPRECFMHDWWVLLVALCSQGQIIFVNKTLSLYRQHAENQIGVVVKPGMKYVFEKTVSFFKIVQYHKNNIIMKKVRICQAKQLLKRYGRTMDGKNKELLETFITILMSKNKLWAYKTAKGNKFIFYNKMYTLKFLFI